MALFFKIVSLAIAFALFYFVPGSCVKRKKNRFQFCEKSQFPENKQNKYNFYNKFSPFFFKKIKKSKYTQ